MNTVNTQAPRSSFVTVVAWIFIVLAGFATLISILQNVMISLMFPMEEMQSAMVQAKHKQDMPAFAEFMFRHFQLFFLSFLVVSSVTLVSAIALLKRKNWARVLFICLMALGIAWNLVGLVLQQYFFSSMEKIPTSAPADFQTQFEIMAMVMRVVTGIIAIGLSALFIWIIKRLTSQDIRQEFVNAR